MDKVLLKQILLDEKNSLQSYFFDLRVVAAKCGVKMADLGEKRTFTAQKYVKRYRFGRKTAK